MEKLCSYLCHTAITTFVLTKTTIPVARLYSLCYRLTNFESIVSHQRTSKPTAEGRCYTETRPVARMRNFTLRGAGAGAKNCAIPAGQKCARATRSTIDDLMVCIKSIISPKQMSTLYQFEYLVHKAVCSRVYSSLKVIRSFKSTTQHCSIISYTDWGQERG